MHTKCFTEIISYISYLLLAHFSFENTIALIWSDSRPWTKGAHYEFCPWIPSMNSIIFLIFLCDIIEQQIIWGNSVIPLLGSNAFQKNSCTSGTRNSLVKLEGGPLFLKLVYEHLFPLLLVIHSDFLSVFTSFLLYEAGLPVGHMEHRNEKHPVFLV